MPTPVPGRSRRPSSPTRSRRRLAGGRRCHAQFLVVPRRLRQTAPGASGPHRPPHLGLTRIHTPYHRGRRARPPPARVRAGSDRRRPGSRCVRPRPAPSPCSHQQAHLPGSHLMSGTAGPYPLGRPDRRPLPSMLTPPVGSPRGVVAVSHVVNDDYSPVSVLPRRRRGGGRRDAARHRRQANRGRTTLVGDLLPGHHRSPTRARGQTDGRLTAPMFFRMRHRLFGSRPGTSGRAVGWDHSGNVH
jgi:hypothetical protein